jgi:hypothetical protein
MAIIVSGVFCVGYQHSEAEVVWNENLLIAIMFAFSVGFFLSTNAFFNRYCTEKNGFTATQLVVDGCMVQAIILLTIWIIMRPEITISDMAIGVLASWCMIFGNIMITQSFKYG